MIKIDEELKRSNIVKEQVQREKDAMKAQMKENQEEFFEKLGTIQLALEAVNANADARIQQLKGACDKDVMNYKVCCLIKINASFVFLFDATCTYKILLGIG
jgi:hypothetical protein